jgi:hypothetical protein
MKQTFVLETFFINSLPFLLISKLHSILLMDDKPYVLVVLHVPGILPSVFVISMEALSRAHISGMGQDNSHPLKA